MIQNKNYCNKWKYRGTTVSGRRFGALSYKYALDEKFLGAIGKVVNPPIYYVYMSAPLFDMQQDEMG